MYTKYNYMYVSTILIITTNSHTSMYTKYNYKHHTLIQVRILNIITCI